MQLCRVDPTVPRPKLMLVGAFRNEVQIFVSSMTIRSCHKLTYGRLWVGEYLDIPVCILKSGVGPERAITSMKEALAICVPDIIISTGSAGSLCNRCHIGDIIIGGPLWDMQSGRRLEMDTQLIDAVSSSLSRTRLPHMVGGIVTSTRVVDTAEVRDGIHRTYGALAVEMESSALAATALENDIPFVCVRAVSDRADASLDLLGGLREGAGTSRRVAICKLVEAARAAFVLLCFRTNLRFALRRVELAVRRLCSDLDALRGGVKYDG